MLAPARHTAPPSSDEAAASRALSLWSGHPLCVALHVDERSLHGPCSMLFGDELWPAESTLVRFEAVHRPPSGPAVRAR